MQKIMDAITYLCLNSNRNMRVSQSTAGVFLFLQYFEENEVSKLKWVEVELWEDEEERYRTVKGPKGSDVE